jgi:hypothetical protein
MQRGKVARELLSWRLIAAILAGMLAGSIIMSPVGAHVTTDVRHLIIDHMKKVFYTKKQANSRFLRKTDSKAVSGFKDGPVDVPSVPSVTQAEATIGTLAVPGGKYAIFAKLYVDAVSTVQPNESVVTCRLEAGTDFDESMTHMFATPWRAAISLQVVHAFPSAGSAVVKCRDDLPASDAGQVYRFLKITAIKQASISSVALT